MKTRWILSSLAALLVIGSLAGAQNLSQTGAPAPTLTAPSAPSPAGFLAALGSSSCSAGPSATALAPLHSLPAQNPAPSPTAVLCGSCSTGGCAGAPFNSGCEYLSGGTYHTGRCQADFTCSNGGNWCICTNNAPP
jgi:hypothetical protein